MSQQPSLFPHLPAPPDPVQRPRLGRVPPWLQYLAVSVWILVLLFLGLFVAILPWTPFWNHNHLLLHFPHLALLALNGVTRGIVSGLGLLNIWIAVDDAIRFKLR